VSAKVRTSNKCDIWKGLVEMIGAGYTKIIRNCSKKGLTSWWRIWSIISSRKRYLGRIGSRWTNL